MPVIPIKLQLTKKKKTQEKRAHYFGLFYFKDDVAVHFS